MCTFMAVAHGKIVSDRWSEYVKEVYELGTTFKWSLEFRKHLINAALTAFSDAVRASIGAVKAVNAATNDLAGVGSEANDPSVTDLVATYGRLGVGGTPMFVKPEASAFSTDHEHKTAPLAGVLRKLRAAMAKEAQKGLMNTAVNVALAAQSGAAFGNEAVSRRRRREKEEKRAASEATTARGKDAPTRGKGQLPTPAVRARRRLTPSTQAATGGGDGGSTALPYKCMAIAKKDFAKYGAGGKLPCMKFETHTTCKLSDTECFFHHRKRPWLADPAALVRPSLRGSGPCPLSGIEALIVYGACPVPGHLDEAASNVYGWAFVAYQVGDVVDAGGIERINQCVTKGDSISDLVSLRRPVTPSVLAARSAAYSEALCAEAAQLLDHIGEATGSVTLFQAEMCDTAVDRATWGDTDIGYVLQL